MQIFDAPWITHEGGSVFSVDIHPSGNKLATAGQDQAGSGLLIVWDIGFVSAAEIADENIIPDSDCSPLARIPHTSSINCVRWSRISKNGRLVCAGDDSVICIYDCAGVYSSMGSISDQKQFNGKVARRNVESYRCTHKLFGHSLDVLHLDWSPDGKYLASCSLDNTVIVWNVNKLPEKVTVLKQSAGGHAKGVKGLAWDPIGRFLATQAEDNSLKIWQTDSWNCVQTFTKPFQESTNSTLFCRMDWSPDGTYLVAPCSMNNGGPTATIFSRKDWTGERDLVGFRKAVSCVRANPTCFQRTNSSGVHTTVSCFAVGSRDRSIALWLLPNFSRPLLVLDKIFKLSVLDLSWNKLTLAACSRDGAIRLIKFGEGEIGHMLSSNEMGTHLERHYGIRPEFNLATESSRNLPGGVSDDFGYTSICEALTKRAANSTLSEMEMAAIAFNKEPPRGKFSPEMLRRFAQRSRKMQDVDRKYTNSEELMVAGTNKEEHTGPKQWNVGRLCERKEETSEGGSNAGVVIFELPEQKKLLFVRIENEEEGGINYLEMCNDCEPGASAPSANLSAFSEKCEKPKWTFFCPHLVSNLAANLRFTAIATFDAHFLLLSTNTGRVLFDTVLEEPIALVELRSNFCLTIGILGNLRLWDGVGRKCVIDSAIGKLFSHTNQQVVAVKTGSEANKFRADFVELLFSDLNSFIYLPKLGEWSQNRFALDLCKNVQMPEDISSMLIQNYSSP